VFEVFNAKQKDKLLMKKTTDFKISGFFDFL